MKIYENIKREMIARFNTPVGQFEEYKRKS